MTPPRASGNPKSASKPAFLLALVLLVFATIFAPSQAEAVTNATPESQTTLTNSISETDPTQSVKGIGRAVAASYTLAEVAQNNSRSGCWTVINGFVYNITDYIKRHPGGEAAISKICGVDGTAIFNNMHGGAAAAAGVTSATACPAGKFSSDTGSTECQVAPKGFFVSTTASSSATQCPEGFTTLASGSTLASDFYKPIAQIIPGLIAPKTLKYKEVIYLPIKTSTNANATAKATGPCSARAVNVWPRSKVAR
jgi:hypothetical protein